MMEMKVREEKSEHRSEHRSADIDTPAQEPGLQGTFTAVLLLGAFLAVSWLGVFLLFLSRQ